ncbi:hypothetical protein [Stutzerimonas chloritidismutans]|uniref:hypothetical protein n=1 Tax=Stutzerimonas chloritidismutans TaxID=203192 RepID=UPI003F18C2AB
MTLNEERGLWAIELEEYAADALGSNVRGYLERFASSDLAKELPSHESAEGLAQLGGILLRSIESGRPPLLGGLRPLPFISKIFLCAEASL